MSENEILQKLRADIDALPSPKRPKQEAFDYVLDSIEAALKRGNSVEEIAKLFAKYGFEFAPSTLRQYLRKSRTPKVSSEGKSDTTKRGKGRSTKEGSGSEHEKQTTSSSDLSEKTTPTQGPELPTAPKSPQSKSGTVHKVF